MNKLIASIITIGTLVGMIFTVDSFYLRSSEFKAFAENYAADKSEARVDALMQRQWKIEDRIDMLKLEGERRNAPAIRELQDQHRELQEQIDREKIRLKAIYEKRK